MKNIIRNLSLVMVCLGASFGVSATIKLPSIFSDNMVLQQNSLVNIWGKAATQEKVVLLPSWSKESVETVADANGYWKVQLKTPQAGGGFSLQVKGTNVILIKNILIGEVWLCSGQSNMDFQIAKEKGWRTGVMDEEQVLNDANYPAIRLFQVKQTLSPVFEQEDCHGEWMICNAENIKKYSAVAFLFGRNLYKELHQPIGLIQASWGSTHAESWTKRSIIDADPVYAPLIEEQRQAWEDYPVVTEKYNEAFAAYEQQSATLIAKGEKPKKAPGKPKDPNNVKTVSTLWNGMIHPLVPYTLKGTIWYQGESNSIRYEAYTQVFSNMIESWRKEFGNPQMPFYFVQIAPQYKQPAEIREAQLQTWKKVPYTGMVVITDAGDSTDIHPRNKMIPAERLARWALAKDYGKEIPFSGPLYKSIEINKGKAVLLFDYLFGGLKTDGNPLTGFEIAGADQVYYPAKAVIRNNQVVVTAKEVKNPVAVRYGWGKFFRVNLYNKAGLPASPFKTH